VVRKSHPAAAFIDELLSVHIKTIEELHRARVLEDLGNLRACRNELQHITVILDGSRTVLSSVAHLQGVFQHGNELLDLAIVKGMARDTPASCQSLQQVHPLIPLPVRGDLNPPLILFNGNRELISRKEVKRALRQAVVDLVQDSVLFCSIEISRELGQFLLPGWKVSSGRRIQDLVRAIKFIPV
jgi:hypothetical protein